jgi:glutaredoxin
MVNSFLYSSTNYFDNHLLTNDLIIVRNHGDYKEDERDIKRALQRQGAAHINVEIKSNSELQSLTSNTTQSLGSPEIQIDVQNAYIIGFGRYT